MGENSLEMFNATPYMLFVVSALIILGGLGFNVYIDINNSKFKFNKYSLHTKIVLVMTLGLVILGTFMFFVLEYSNVNTRCV